MTEAGQASDTPEAKAKTPTPEEGEQSQKAEADAGRKQTDLTDEQKQQKAENDRRAEQGRELKAQKARADAAEGKLAEEREKREKLWYSHPDTPQEEKDAWRRSREQEQKTAPAIAQANARAALADAIADEDNPQVRKALKAIRANAEATKVYPDPSVIAALRVSLTPEGEGTEQPSEKTPPNVTASRGTRAAAGPSIEDEIKTAEESVRKKDGNYSYGNLLALRQKQQMETRAAQG